MDSNKEKCNCEFKDISVKHVDDVKYDLGKYKIVIMTANRNAALVGKDLEKLGLQDGKDFCSMEQFLTEWFWNYKKQVCLMEVHSTITSRCTLKCKHCNMFMPYYKEHVDYTAKVLCVICGMTNMAYKREDGVYVVPITALGP